jgi:hypothetical protein
MGRKIPPYGSVHVTPTVFINGIEAPDVSSRWSYKEWLEKLRPMITEG